MHLKPPVRFSSGDACTKKKGHPPFIGAVTFLVPGYMQYIGDDMLPMCKKRNYFITHGLTWVTKGGGNSKNFWNFHPYILGEDEPILTHIFQMG